MLRPAGRNHRKAILSSFACRGLCLGGGAMSDVRSVEPDAAADPGQELAFDDYIAQLPLVRRALSKLFLAASFVCGLLILGALVFAIYVSVTGQDRIAAEILSAWMFVPMAIGVAGVFLALAMMSSGAVPPLPSRGESKDYSTGWRAIATGLFGLVLAVIMIALSITIIWNALGLG